MKITSVLLALSALNGATAARLLRQEDSACPALEGYDFIQGADSWGFDVTEQLSGDPAQLAAYCGETSGCIAFTSNGWLKSSLNDPLDAWAGAGACDGLYVAATPYVCIRPLKVLDWMDEAAPAVHCYIEAGSWSTAYDTDGLHPEVDTQDDTKECVAITGAVLPALQTAASRAAGSGDYEAGDYALLTWNCCHYVDRILQEAGSQGVTSYFPGWELPAAASPPEDK